MSKDIVVNLDTREPPKMKKLFKKHGMKYRSKTMKCGDYESPEVLIERKTVLDLVGSINGKKLKEGGRKEGRLFSQMSRMAEYCEENGKVPFLFVSGDINEAIEFFEMKGLTINVKSVLGALMSIIIRYNISVYWVFEDDDELVWCMKNLFEKVRDGKYGIPHRDSIKTNSNRKVAVWMTILRVTPKVAKDLMKKFGSLENFLRILRESPDEIESIKGIGPSTITKWKKSLE